MNFDIKNGDCLKVLKDVPDNFFDAIVTDPPYGLSKNQNEQTVRECMAAWLKGEEYTHCVGGFAEKEWDSWVPSPMVWKECYRVLKPGGYCLVFAGTRTQDLMGISLRLANFEIRDSIRYMGEIHSTAMVYGSGFPKNRDVGKEFDRKAGAERETVGVKAGHEYFANKEMNDLDFKKDSGFDRPWLKDKEKRKQYHMETAPSTDMAKKWNGWGTNLKPAQEHIIMCRKPLEGMIVENIEKYGVGAINIEASRVKQHKNDDYGRSRANSKGVTPSYNGLTDSSTFKIKERPAEYASPFGRYPANIIHDGSEQVIKEFPDTISSAANNDIEEVAKGSASRFFKSCEWQKDDLEDIKEIHRFYYTSKASKKDKNEGLKGIENNHPTVKSTSLMRYLVKLVTPKDGIILDPFMGSGSTGKAAILEGFNFHGIELNPDYCKIAEQRIKNANSNKQLELF